MHILLKNILGFITKSWWIQFLEGGDTLVTNIDNIIIFYNFGYKKIIKKFISSKRVYNKPFKIYLVSLPVQDKFLLVLYNNDLLICWNIYSNTCYFSIKIKSNNISYLNSYPQNDIIYFGSNSGFIVVIEFSSLLLLTNYRAHENNIINMKLVHGILLITCDINNIVKFWDKQCNHLFKIIKNFNQNRLEITTSNYYNIIIFNCQPKEIKSFRLIIDDSKISIKEIDNLIGLKQKTNLKKIEFTNKGDLLYFINSVNSCEIYKLISKIKFNRRNLSHISKQKYFKLSHIQTIKMNNFTLKFLHLEKVDTVQSYLLKLYIISNNLVVHLVIISLNMIIIFLLDCYLSNYHLFKQTIFLRNVEYFVTIYLQSIILWKVKNFKMIKNIKINTISSIDEIFPTKLFIWGNKVKQKSSERCFGTKDVFNMSKIANSELSNIIFLKNINKVVSISKSNEVKLWIFKNNIETNKIKFYLLLHKEIKLSNILICVKISRNEKLLFISFIDKTLRVYFLNSFNFFYEYSENFSIITSICLSYDDKMLYCGTMNGSIIGIEVLKGYKKFIKKLYYEPILDLSCLLNTEYLITISVGSKLKIWNLINLNNTFTIDTGFESLKNIYVSSKYHTITTLSINNTVKSYQIIIPHLNIKIPKIKTNTRIIKNIELETIHNRFERLIKDNFLKYPLYKVKNKIYYYILKIINVTGFKNFLRILYLMNRNNLIYIYIILILNCKKSKNILLNILLILRLLQSNLKIKYYFNYKLLIQIVFLAHCFCISQIGLISNVIYLNTDY